MAERAASSRLRIVIAVLIGTSSVLGAVVAWRATIAESQATTAERKGFTDEVARERARVEILDYLGTVHSSYIRGTAYKLRAEELRQRAKEVPADQRVLLIAEAEAYDRLSDTNLDTVPEDARTPVEGAVPQDAEAPVEKLDLETVFDIEWDQAQREEDLDPEPEFHDADVLLTKSERLIGLSALLIAGVFFLTVAEFSRSVVYRIYFFGGSAVLIVAAALVIVVEVG